MEASSVFLSTTGCYLHMLIAFVEGIKKVDFSLLWNKNLELNDFFYDQNPPHFRDLSYLCMVTIGSSLFQWFSPSLRTMMTKMTQHFSWQKLNVFLFAELPCHKSQSMDSKLQSQTIHTRFQPLLLQYEI